jgi:hypothetical protein
VDTSQTKRRDSSARRAQESRAEKKEEGEELYLTKAAIQFINTSCMVRKGIVYVS